MTATTSMRKTVEDLITFKLTPQENPASFEDELGWVAFVSDSSLYLGLYLAVNFFSTNVITKPVFFVGIWLTV